MAAISKRTVACIFNKVTLETDKIDRWILLLHYLYNTSQFKVIRTENRVFSKIFWKKIYKNNLHTPKKYPKNQNDDITCRYAVQKNLAD